MECLTGLEESERSVGGGVKGRGGKGLGEMEARRGEVQQWSYVRRKIDQHDEGEFGARKARDGGDEGRAGG